MQADAELGQTGGEGRRVRPIAVAALNGLVRDKPRVAAAAASRARMLPPGDIGRVLILHTECETIKRRARVRREVKQEFVTVVEKPVRIDRFVMSNGEVVGEACPGTGGVLVDGNRLYPVDDVLERQMRARRLRDI